MWTRLRALIKERMGVAIVGVPCVYRHSPRNVQLCDYEQGSNSSTVLGAIFAVCGHTEGLQRADTNYSKLSQFPGTVAK